MRDVFHLYSRAIAYCPRVFMHHDEYMRIAEMPADNFRVEAFALANIELYNAYVELRLRGYAEYDAFTKSFPEIVSKDVNNALIFGRATNVEHNPYTRGRFEKRLKTIEMSELWGDRIAINELLQLVRDKMVKDAVRLGAIKELNVLLDITITDEHGKTKKNRDLSKFYEQQGAPLPDATQSGVASGPVQESDKS
jgi:hypothetical protein